MKADSAGVPILTNDLTQVTRQCTIGAEPEVTIGSAEAGPEYELHRVFGASRLSDGRIVLVNQGSQELRFYDSTGRYLLSAGREGRGPGEFADAFLLWVLPGDTIWVGDYRPWQFLVFAPNGQWIRTVRPEPLLPNPPAEVEVLDDGRVVMAERTMSEAGENWGERRITLVQYDQSGHVADTIGTYRNGRWGVVSGNTNLNLYPLFEAFARIDAGGNTLITAHSSEPEFVVHTIGDAVTRKQIVRWNTGSRAITPADIDAERKRLAEPYSDLNPVMRKQLVEPLLSEERPVADRFPAFSSLQLGKDGRVWVREFVKPAEPREQRWLVFDADGRFSCRATLPTDAQALEFGADYLITLQRDELGIEQVMLHRLTS